MTSKLLFLHLAGADNDTGLGLSRSSAGTCLTLFLPPGSARSLAFPAPAPPRPASHSAASSLARLFKSGSVLPGLVPDHPYTWPPQCGLEAFFSSLGWGSQRQNPLGLQKNGKQSCWVALLISQEAASCIRPSDQSGVPSSHVGCKPGSCWPWSKASRFLASWSPWSREEGARFTGAPSAPSFPGCEVLRGDGVSLLADRGGNQGRGEMTRLY